PVSERLFSELLSEARCWREDRVWHLGRARSQKGAEGSSEAVVPHPATPRLIYEATLRAVEAARVANHRFVELKRLVRSLDPQSVNYWRQTDEQDEVARAERPGIPEAVRRAGHPARHKAVQGHEPEP